MPRMNTLMLLEEPRPCTIFMLGTAPCKPSMLLACRSFSSFSPNAVTATGTSWIDSTRRRAVTVTVSRVLAVSPSCALACGASWAIAGTAANRDSANTPWIAVLNCLRFICPFLPGTC